MYCKPYRNAPKRLQRVVTVAYFLHEPAMPSGQIFVPVVQKDCNESWHVVVNCAPFAPLA